MCTVGDEGTGSGVGHGEGTGAGGGAGIAVSEGEDCHVFQCEHRGKQGNESSGRKRLVRQLYDGNSPIRGICCGFGASICCVFSASVGWGWVRVGGRVCINVPDGFGSATLAMDREGFEAPAFSLGIPLFPLFPRLRMSTKSLAKVPSDR